MVLAAVEQNEPPGRRLVDDDFAELFLPAPLRWLVGATRFAPVRHLMIRGSEFTGPGLWANLACRKRFIADKLKESLDDINAVVILGAGLDTRAYLLTRRVRIPVFEVDLPVNVARKFKTVRRVLGELPLSVRLVALDLEHDDLLTALAEHGYRTDYRVFFICEGVTQYLSEATVRRTLTAARGRPGQPARIHLCAKRFHRRNQPVRHPHAVPQRAPAAPAVAFRFAARRGRRLPRRVRLAAGGAGRTRRTHAAVCRAHRPQTQSLPAGMVGLRGEDLATAGVRDT